MIEIIIRQILGLIKLLIDQLGNNDVQCVVTVQIERLITEEEGTENNIKRASSPTPFPGRGKELGRETAVWGSMLIRVGHIAFKDMYKLQLGSLSP